MNKRILAGITSMFMTVIMLFPLVEFTAYADDADMPIIMLEGINVTENNADDILGDKTAYYDVKTNTLTFNNYKLPENPNQYMAYILAVEGDINIELVGNNQMFYTMFDNINTTTFCPIKVTGDLNISGTGSIKLTMDELEAESEALVTTGIMANNITISGAKVDINMAKITETVPIDENNYYFGYVASAGILLNDGNITVDSKGELTIQGADIIQKTDDKGGQPQYVYVQSYGIYGNGKKLTVDDAKLTASGGNLKCEIAYNENAVSQGQSMGISYYGKGQTVKNSAVLKASGGDVTDYSYGSTKGLDFYDGTTDIYDSVLDASSGDIKAYEHANLSTAFSGYGVNSGINVYGDKSDVKLTAGDTEGSKSVYSVGACIYGGDFNIYGGKVNIDAGRATNKKITTDTCSYGIYLDYYEENKDNGNFYVECDNPHYDSEVETYYSTSVNITTDGGKALCARKAIKIGKNLIIGDPLLWNIGEYDGYYASDYKTITDMEGKVSENIVIMHDSYNVRFEGMDFELSIPVGMSIKQFYGDIADDMKKEGFVFGGVYKDSDFTQAYDIETVVTENIKLFPKWVEEIYSVTVNDSEDGVTIDNTGNKAGAKVTFSIKPAAGKTVVSVQVKDAYENIIEVVKNDDGTYSFVQPDSDVTITVRYSVIDTDNDNDSATDTPMGEVRGLYAWIIIMTAAAGTGIFTILKNR